MTILQVYSKQNWTSVSMCGQTPLHKTELLPLCVTQKTSLEKSGLGQCQRENTKLNTKDRIFDKFC